MSIVVFGATGAQGGSVVRHLLGRGKKVRAVTRNPESEAAKKLKAAGVEIAKADQWKADEVRKAVEGAYGVFALTDFWRPENMGKEVQLGKIMADAAKEAGVKHFVFSDLANVAKESKGKYHVPHFTDKCEAADYAESLGFQYFTRVRPPFYFQNFCTFFAPKKEGDTLVWSIPMPDTAYLTAFDVEDYGEPVAHVFEHPEEYNHKIVPVATEHLHPQDFVSIFSKVTGVPSRIQHVPLEQFAKAPFPGAAEMAQMFGWFTEYTYFGAADPMEYRAKAYPNAKSWEQWLRASGWKGESAAPQQ